MIHQGKYLCETVSEWQALNTKEVDIKWGDISAMLLKKSIELTGKQCHALWKYIAYGINCEIDDDSDFSKSDEVSNIIFQY